MVLKRDFLRRLNRVILISFILFLIFIGAYFFMSFNSKINSINVIVTSIADSFENNTNVLGSLRRNISEMTALFLTQLTTFIIAILTLLTSLWYTTKRYLVEKKNALVDSLTGLYNKKAILFHLKQELLRTGRYGHPTTVAILDLDFFKKYNDVNGHVAGDRLLKRLGKILHEEVREYDEVGRFGGEEFVIVFPETKIKDAYDVCERIRKKIEKTNFAGKNNMPDKRVTVSIGISEIKGKKKMKGKTLLGKADDLLYKAKKSGRNKVIYKEN